jgi:hypothetical protein
MNARTLALLVAAGLAGCVGNNSSVEMAAICSFTEDCTFSGECDTMMGAKPWVDVSMTDEMILMVQFNNQVPNNENVEVGRLNTKDARITSYEVTYDPGDIAGGTIDVNYLIPAGGTAVLPVWVVIPGSGADLSLGAVPPNPLTGAASVVAHVVARGSYQDGGDFKTAEYDVALDVLNGGGPAGCEAFCPFIAGQIAQGPGCMSQ